MNPNDVLWLGGAAVVGASVMAVALIWGGRLFRRDPARQALIETPTADSAQAKPDPAVFHFQTAMDDLLPVYIADAPGIPLRDTEERVIKEIERLLVWGDPDFAALFEGPDQT